MILFGFWMGDEQTFPDASFYSFIVPEPAGLRDAPLVGGEWTSGGLAVLPYEIVRAARDPRAFLLSFSNRHTKRPQGARAGHCRVGVRVVPDGRRFA